MTSWPPRDRRGDSPWSWRAHGRWWVLLVLLAGSGLGFESRITLAAGGAGRENASWREPFQCGPNALYMFLRFHGWSGALRDVRAVVPVEDHRGCSLEALRSGARALGMATRIVRTNREGLDRLGLPAVTHHVETGANPDGHYYLVVGLNERMPSGVRAVTVIDPIEATQFHIPTSEFDRTWTTYAVVLEKNSWWRFGPQLLLAATGCVLIASTFGSAISLWKGALVSRERRHSPALSGNSTSAGEGHGPTNAMEPTALIPLDHGK